MSRTSKKITILFLLVFVMTCTACSGKKEDTQEDKLKIVATLFPSYDFARQIAGDKAEVTLLLDPGVEAHDYDPTSADMIKINKADIFIYTGDNMEHWAGRIINSLETSNVTIVDASEGIELLETKDIEEESSREASADVDEHTFDPHIWTSPKNAMIMVNTILEAVVKVDPKNESYYRQNAAAYVEELKALDSEFIEIMTNAKYSTIYFGGRFAFAYFAKEYGLGYMAAFDSCSAETEPSAKLVTKIVDAMKKNGATIVYYEELSNNKTARAIAEEVGGKTKLLHSCHNVSNKDFVSGETYVSLMKKNAENLREGLGEENTP